MIGSLPVTPRSVPYKISALTYRDCTLRRQLQHGEYARMVTRYVVRDGKTRYTLLCGARLYTIEYPPDH